MSRRQKRYENRQLKREQHRVERAENVGSLEDIFTFHDMIHYGRECCKGVRWKQSVQNFERHLFSGSAARLKQLLEEKYKWHKCTRFTLRERGKIRTIDAPHIHDRQIQKILTQKVLLECYKALMIYNNGASLKGKGLSFSQKQLKKDLSYHFRKYGMEGWVIVADFKGFFPNADHTYIKNTHNYIKLDDKVCRLLNNIFDNFKSGLPLGVEVSQAEMIMYPSKLDNYMKCQMGLKGFGHYMDDYVILVPPNLDPNYVLEKFKLKAKENHLIINEHKTHIYEFGQPFRFCKTKYIVTKTGRIITHGGKDAIYRALRKMKKLKDKVSMNDILAIVNACDNYYRRSNDNGRLLKLWNTFYQLFA